MAVFVLDRQKNPLMPCSEKRARLLLARKRAVVARVYPFTIRLKDRAGGAVQKVVLKIDPGSKETGMAVSRVSAQGEHVLCLIELTHRGRQISKALDQRRGFRSRRRGQLRYRAPRFNNRTKPKGWLAPSLQHRVDTTISVIKRLRALVPVTSTSQELVRFDLQQMENPEISGVVEQVLDWEKPRLRIKATGRGSYKRTRLTKHGFPRGYLMREKSVYGFQTGDMIRAIVPTGKKEGTWLGRVAIRKTGSFNIQTSDGAVQGIHHRHCQLMQRADGYGYHLQPTSQKGGGKQESLSC